MTKTRILAMMLALSVTGAMTGCGNGTGNAGGNTAATEVETAADTYREDVTTAQLQAAVAEELGENYWPNMDVPTELLGDTFGITEEMYEEVTAQMPMISTNVDTLVIVKAREGSEQDVEAALLAWKEYNTQEAMQYPMNMGKVQAAAVKTIGRYVCLVQLGADTMAASEEGDEAVIAQCEQENARALAVIEEMLTK